jgi:hypothetical protein
MSLQLPQDSPSRPLSIRTTGTSATMADKTGEAWRGAVDKHNCWEDLILTLGTLRMEFEVAATRSLAHRRATEAWHANNVITDGGGIRGYSSLLIVQQLMKEIAACEIRLQDSEGPVPGSTRKEFNEAELLPCHSFDYMYGTSTGGLISVMLARLRMTVPQCLEIYRQVGHELFGHRRNILPLATKYHHKPLERAVQKIVSQYCKLHVDCDGTDLHPWDWDPEDEESPNPSAASTVNSQSTYKSIYTDVPIKPIDRICQS